MNKKEFINAGFSVLDAENKENKLLSFLKEHYPSVIKDNEIDLNELKAIAGLPIDDKVNGYGLNFVGRNFARAKYAQRTEKELQLNTSFSKNIDTTQNLVLKGDNLDSLKILKNHYSGKIKMIYIDPPYNTDKDEFVYPDKFDKEEAEVLGLANLSENDFARMDFSFKTKKSHNGWLAFMYPRLLSARDLLSKDGVIFISIDDNEQANLKLLCDDVFGEENFVGNISVENNPKGRKNSDYISITNDYLLIYAKQKGESYFIENIPKNIKDLSFDEETGKYIHGSGKRVLVGENSFNKKVSNLNSDKHYSVYYNKSINDLIIKKENDINNVDSELIDNGYKRFISIKGKEFIENTYTSGKLIDLFQNKALEFKNGKIFEKNFNTSIRIKSILTNQKYDAYFYNQKSKFILDLKTTSAGTYLKELFKTKESVFPMSKNIGLIKVLLSLFEEKNFIILDFFAGSGTTGDAVMQLNAEDGGNRKFILCQIDEPIDKKKNKTAYDFCVENNLPPVISSITIERLKRAGEKIAKEIEVENKKSGMFKEHKKQVQDIGYKVFNSVEAPKLQVEETGQISIMENDTDALSRIYNMIFTVGLDEPTQVPVEVKKDCIYKIENHYYITNSDKITSDDFSNVIKNGKVFIDGWTASLDGTLQNYKEDVKIIF